jgi:hypothetical protein
VKQDLCQAESRRNRMQSDVRYRQIVIFLSIFAPEQIAVGRTLNLFTLWMLTGDYCEI